MTYDMRLSHFVPDEVQMRHMQRRRRPRLSIPRPSEPYENMVILRAALVLFLIGFFGLTLGALLAAWVAR